MEFLKGKKQKEAEKWMLEAAKIARKAKCHRANCGTVIIKGGRIIGKGYNAPPLDKEENRRCGEEFVPGKPKYDKTCCMHAEWRAIMGALKRVPKDIRNSKLYFTRVNEKGEIEFSGKPFCTVCSRMALDVGIKKFALWHKEGICEYDTHEYNNLSYNYIPEL